MAFCVLLHRWLRKVTKAERPKDFAKTKTRVTHSDILMFFYLQQVQQHVSRCKKIISMSPSLCSFQSHMVETQARKAGVPGTERATILTLCKLVFPAGVHPAFARYTTSGQERTDEVLADFTKRQMGMAKKMTELAVAFEDATKVDFREMSVWGNFALYCVLCLVRDSTTLRCLSEILAEKTDFEDVVSVNAEAFMRCLYVTHIRYAGDPVRGWHRCATMPSKMRAQFKKVSAMCRRLDLY
jgi:hypothetical protein